MKQTIILFSTLLMPYYFFGQNNTDYTLPDNNMENFVPSDFDKFWLFNDGCGTPVLNDTYTYMDTFRFFFRKPFSRYLLGNYYCGHVLDIDSITAESSFSIKRNDSIRFVYATFGVVEQYSSRYNKEIYWFPILDDIKYDSTNDFQYYKQLQQMLNDTAVQIKKVCIMMTKQEMEILGLPTIYPKEILLRMTSDAGSESSGIVFCFQPFLDGYSEKELVSRKQIAIYKIHRYEQLYYDLFKKKFPQEILNENSK